MKIYIHPKCSTCKSALKFLDNAEVRYQLVDITKHAPSLTELRTMLSYQDGVVRKLFNTSGMQYRELNLSKKLPDLSEQAALKLLAANGMLVKRPFLLTKTAGVVGFKKPEWEELL